MTESLISNKYEKEKKKKKKIKDEKSSLTVVSVHSIERWIIRLRLSFDYQSWCVSKFEWNLNSLCIANKASKCVLWRCSLHTKQDQNVRMNKDERESSFNRMIDCFKRKQKILWTWIWSLEKLLDPKCFPNVLVFHDEYQVERTQISKETV
jgi:hypothetical protein